MFDPLHKWLGIPPNEQPPNHYRLLGITVYENDPDVIDAAADKQLAFLHDLTNGERAEMAEQLSNQVSAARICLLDDEKKIAYDHVLRNGLEKQRPAEPSPEVSQPGIEPSYQIPQSNSQPVGTISSQIVRTKKRRKSADSSRSALSYSRVSTLLCVVALALIGIGVWQGRITLNRSLLESLGLMSSTEPSPIPRTDNLTSQDSSAGIPKLTPGRTAASAANQATSQAKKRDAETPPADPTTPSVPSPKPREKSLAELAHSSSTAIASTPQVEKSPLPSEAELDEKMALVRELYEENYRNAKTTLEKIELAKLMHRDGQETTDDTAGRFALWQVAHDILTREGEYALALGIVDNLNAHYIDIDLNRRKVKTLFDSASHVALTRVSGFLDAVVSVVTDCGQQDQFELAKSLAAFTTKEFGSRSTKSRLTALEAASSEIEARERLFKQYQAALETLKTSEDDPDANQQVGHYLCFIRGQWDQGLKHLALGSDAKTRAAAVRELATQSNLAGAMAVADAWYGIAENQNGSLGQTNLRGHAYQWYEKAKPNSQGLDLKKIEARLAELGDLIPNHLDEPGVAGESDLSKLLGYRKETSKESKSDFAERKGNEFTLGMGSRPDGRGEAMAGIELTRVKKLKIVGSASQQMLDIDPYSKTGFVIDYHTPGGYSKRIFLGLGLRPGRRFSDAPPWGAAKSPDLTLDIGRSDAYEIDLTRWAPSTWDGQCWFTLYMQNVGANRTLFSTVSW